MKNNNPFRYIKTSPEIIRLVVKKIRPILTGHRSVSRLNDNDDETPSYTVYYKTVCSICSGTIPGIQVKHIFS
jgi:hypothetical protein